MKKALSFFGLTAALLLGINLPIFAAELPQQNSNNINGTLEKMMVTAGSVEFDLDLNRVRGTEGKPRAQTCRFGLGADSAFTVLIFDQVVRGPERGSMQLL